MHTITTTPDTSTNQKGKTRMSIDRLAPKHLSEFSSPSWTFVEGLEDMDADNPYLDHFARDLMADAFSDFIEDLSPYDTEMATKLFEAVVANLTDSFRHHLETVETRQEIRDFTATDIGQYEFVLACADRGDQSVVKSFLFGRAFHREFCA